MKVLTRYLLRSHIGPFFFAFLALTGVVLINTLARSLASLAGKGLPARVFFEFFVLSLPANIALTLPMSVLVAVLYSFSQMAAENEITALKAGGIDLRRMVLPLVVVAAVIAAGMIWFNDRVLPAANFRWRMLMVDVAQASPLLALREQVVNPIPSATGTTQYYLQAGRLDEKGNRMMDVTIFDLSSGDATRTIYADSAWVAYNATRTDLILRLFHGSIREVPLTSPETFNETTFSQQVLRMAGVSQQLQRTQTSGYRTDRDMTVAMMEARIDTFRYQLRELHKRQSQVVPPSAGVRPEVDATGKEVPFAESRARTISSQIRELQVEIQKKYSIAIATLVFVLIGVPMALRFPRGGIGMVIAVSLTVFSIYYVGLIGGESLADAGYVPPWLAMWTANILFGSLGLAGLWRAGREQSSGRGSGWGDLPRWPRLPARRRAAGRVAEAS